MTDWHPTAGPEALRARARLLALIRAWFEEHPALEVETPLLSAAGNSDPGIQQVGADSGSAWLRTSPEYPMKRLLAAGSDDIYELGRVFRRGETGAWHNPEFTLLEWYRVGRDYLGLAAEASDLVRHCGAQFGHAWGEQRQTYRELFRDLMDIDPLAAGRADLAACAAAHGVEVANPGSLDRDAWLDLLMSHVAQPRLPADAVTCVHDYPASQAALARIRPGEPAVAERFELFIGPLELANGYQELTDPIEQRRRFESEQSKRQSDGQDTAPLDENLLAALAAGLPDCAGVALGVDRLLMACLGAGQIEEVLAFPAGRA